MPAVKVNISAEGLRALHGTKLPGSIDIKAEQERMRYASEHQPVESFRSRLAREFQHGTENLRAEKPYGKVTIEDPKMAIVSCQRMRNWIFFSRNLRNLPNPGLERNSRKPLKW